MLARMITAEEEPLEVLRAARQQLEFSEVSSAVISRSMLTAAVIFGASCLLAIGSLLAFIFDVPKIEAARVFTVFVSLGSVGLAMAAAFGFGLVAWRGYVQQRVHTLEAKVREKEATDQAKSFVRALSSEQVFERATTSHSFSNRELQTSRTVLRAVIEQAKEAVPIELEEEEDELAVITR